MRNSADHHRQYRVGFVMEQAMGHVTHHRTLAGEVERDPEIRPTWMEIQYRDDDLWQRLPGVRGNMSLLLSLRARREIRALRQRSGPFDALFFHTQLTALLSHHIMRCTPSVISLDATPLNRDPRPHSQATQFSRIPDGKGPWDRLKYEWYRRAFSRASSIIAWSEWARRSLIEDYDIESEKVTVIPPGIDLDLWQAPQRPVDPAADKPRLLFVGVDFDRKGGDVLMQAFRGPLAGRAVLDVVSPEASSLPPQTADIHVHRNLSINSPELRELFFNADVFVLPTHNDCTPLAVLEAMGSGLPVIASDVGAIREQVVHGATGLLVAPDDVAGLAAAITSLLNDPCKRVAMGAAGRARAEQLFNARKNYPRVVSLIKQCVSAFEALQACGSATSPGGASATGGLRVTTGGRAWASEH